MIPVILLLGTIAFLTLLFHLILEGRKNYGFLENCGFPVIKPTLFLGSVPTLHKQVHFLEDIKRFKKYGNIWGLYQGLSPQVYVADPELFRSIYVKDFEHFYDRRVLDLGHGLVEEVLDFLPGEKWKKVRTLLSPFFTTSKLKNMVDVIEIHAQEYISNLEKQCRESGQGFIKFDCRKQMSTYLVDMFTRTMLGIKLEDSENLDNEFVKAFRTLLGDETHYGWLYSLSMSFPFLSKLSPHFEPQNEQVIQRVIDGVILNRSSSSDTTGYIHLWHEMLDQLGSPEFQELGITQKTIISQIVNFYLGGFDTSSTTISHLLYYLSKNPAKQNKLYEEVVSKFPKNKLLNYQQIRGENAPFLMGCIKEAIRLAPAVIRPERICTKDWNHNGITIKKGTEVFIPAWAVHRNPKYWPNPEEFYPERFLPETQNQNEGLSNANQYAFTSFGHGPRNCIGERFAYESIKIIMIHLVRSFEFKLRADTEIKYKPGSLFMVNFESLYLDCALRK